MSIDLVHFHLGADSVGSRLISRTLCPPVLKLFCDPMLEEVAESFHVVSEPEFVTHFKRELTHGEPVDFAAYQQVARVQTSTLVLSRDKFLFGGVPMNKSGGFENSLYKMINAQKALQGVKVIFHFFITDHVSYFERKETDLSLGNGCSWIPVVEGIAQQINSPNELWVWGAEHVEGTARSLLINLVGAEPAEANYCVDTQIRLPRPPEHKSEALEDWEATIQLEMDMAYERDLVHLENGPVRYIDCSEG